MKKSFLKFLATVFVFCFCAQATHGYTAAPEEQQRQEADQQASRNVSAPNTPEKVNIPKKTLTANYNDLLGKQRITASDRKALKIDEVNDNDMADFVLREYKNSDIVKGEVIYQNKTGKLMTVYVVVDDHMAQTHVLSYDAAGNYIDHILVCYHFIYRGDRRTAIIQGDKITMTAEWGNCEEDCSFSFEGSITPELKFVKPYLNQPNESGTETSVATNTETATQTSDETYIAPATEAVIPTIAETSVSIEDNPATLYIYRERKLLGSILAVRYDIVLDNMAIARTNNNWKTTVKVTSSGLKTLSATIDGRKAEIQVNIASGGVYYLRCDYDTTEIDTGKKGKDGKAVKDFIYTPILQLVDKTVGEGEFNRIK